MGDDDFVWNHQVNSLTICLSHIIKASLKMLAERYF
jgi:hypothetical protein